MYCLICGSSVIRVIARYEQSGIRRVLVSRSHVYFNGSATWIQTNALIMLGFTLQRNILWGTRFVNIVPQVFKARERLKYYEYNVKQKLKYIIKFKICQKINPQIQAYYKAHSI